MTIAGKELAPIVLGLGEWGMRWARGQMTDDELDVELLMYDLRRCFDETRLPDGQTVVHFAFEGLQKFPYWWIVLDGRQRDLCVDNPGKPVDLTISTNLRTLTEMWTGDAELRQAIRTGGIKLKGSDILARSIGDWMQIGMFAHVRPAVLAEDS